MKLILIGGPNGQAYADKKWPPGQPRVEMLDHQPRVYVTLNVYQKMCLYVKECPVEVGWLGEVEQTANGDFLIVDVIIFRQDVGPIETTLNEQHLADYAAMLMAMGDAGIAKVLKTRFWGHSHVNYAVKPSGLDNETMTNLGKVNPWFIRGILNKHGDVEFTIYLYKQGIKIVSEGWNVVVDVPDELVETARKELVENLTFIKEPEPPSK